MAVFGWFGRKGNETIGSDAKTVRVYLTPLPAMLGAAEKQKGSPLTQARVLHVRGHGFSRRNAGESSRSIKSEPLKRW